MEIGKQRRFKSLAITPLALVLVGLAGGCGVDKESPEYDERRYNELQKANCDDIAYVLARPLLSKETVRYEDSLQRCQDMKSLSFSEYQMLADHARAVGYWDLYEVFPEKRKEIKEGVSP